MDKFQLERRKFFGSGCKHFDLRDLLAIGSLDEAEIVWGRPRLATSHISTTSCENAAAAHS